MDIDHDTQPQEDNNKKGFCSRIFNKAAAKDFVVNVGFGATIAGSLKAAAGYGLATASVASPVGILAGTVIASGLIATPLTEHFRSVRSMRKEQVESGQDVGNFATDFFSMTNIKSSMSTMGWKGYLKKASLNMAGGAVGGGLVIGASEIDWSAAKEGLQNGIENMQSKLSSFSLFASKPALPVSEDLLCQKDDLSLSGPVPAPCIEDMLDDTLTDTFDSSQPFSNQSVAAITGYNSFAEMPALDKMSWMIDSITDKNDSVEALYELMEKISPDANGNYSAGDYQRMKDMAYFAYNGFEGFSDVPEDVRRSVAAEIYQIAAEGGNIQAQTDLAFIQYNGTVPNVIQPDAESALKTINSLDRSWTGGEKLLDTYNPETAHLSKIDLGDTSPIVECDVTQKPAALFEKTQYSFECHNITSQSATAQDYTQYNLKNFDILGEEKVSMKLNFESANMAVTNFLDSTTHKFMNLLSSAEHKTPHVAMR